MLYADRVIDEFETYDYESLFHVSLKLLEQLKEHYELHYASEDSKLFMFSCVMYFTTLSGYSDGVEQRLVREIFSFNDILSNIEEYRLKIRDNGWFEIVEKTPWWMYILGFLGILLFILLTLFTYFICGGMLFA